MDDVGILQNLYNKIVSQKEEGLRSLSTDNTRDISYGPNSTKSKKTVAKEQFSYSSQATQAKQVDQANWENQLVASVFNSEGGYSTDKKDTGNYDTGEVTGNFIGTNHGISAPVLASFLGRTPTKQEMKDLTQGEAAGIYKDQYYTKYGIDSLPRHLQEITFHSVVNSGGHGTEVMQKMVGVAEDGVVGPQTREAFSKAEFSKIEFKDELMKKYKTFRTWGTHGEGWTNRFEELAK